MCKYCHALHWAAEAVEPDEYGDCCLHGKVDVPLLEPLPDDLRTLYCENTTVCKEFRTHIRYYNKAFAFTSTGGSHHLDGTVLDGHGPPCYKIQGELYHQLGPVLPEDNHRPLYSQLYIFDNAQALGERERNNPLTKHATMSLLQNMLQEHDPFVCVYEQAYRLTQTTLLPTYRLCLDFVRATDRRTYNMPQAEHELAAIIPGDVGACINSRQVIVRPKGGPLLHINECHPGYIPLHFPLLCPTGQAGWNTDMRQKAISNADGSTTPQRRLTFCNFLQFRLHPRPSSVESDHYFRAAGLLQEYIVEMWVAAGHSRLRWIRDHQKDLRAELYTGVLDALEEGLQPSAIGRKVVLPASFTSGPRFMQKNLQHALTLLRIFGGSDLFITFTANPAWLEITEAILLGQNASDRPDIVARVFRLKFESFLDEVMKKKLFGKALGYVYAIEYQKRGLPHAHTIFFLHPSCRLSTPERVDAIISSEFPDPNREPLLFELVKMHMIHGPCGLDRVSPCVDTSGHCSKGFPMSFQPTTDMTAESYVKTRRRATGLTYSVRDAVEILACAMATCPEYESRGIRCCTTLVFGLP